MKHGGRVLSTSTDLPSSSFVADLLDAIYGGWNTSLIDSNFLPFEAQQIKAIPISSFQQPDHLYWPGNKNGDYLVKSGYNLLCIQENSDRP